MQARWGRHLCWTICVLVLWCDIGDALLSHRGSTSSWNIDISLIFLFIQIWCSYSYKSSCRCGKPEHTCFLAGELFYLHSYNRTSSILIFSHDFSMNFLIIYYFKELYWLFYGMRWKVPHWLQVLVFYIRNCQQHLWRYYSHNSYIHIYIYIYNIAIYMFWRILKKWSYNQHFYCNIYQFFL